MPTTQHDQTAEPGAPAVAERLGPAHRPPRPAGGGTAPLWAVLVFSFVASVGTGIVTNGIFFLAKHGYGFSDTQNYLLGLLEGVTYIAGAMGAGPVVRRVRERFGLSTRAVVGAILFVLAADCALPILGRAGAGGAQWPVWALMAVYSPVSGALWPIVESYVSGGRSGAALRSALGRFNVTWSSATVAGYWILGPLTKSHAVAAVAGVGVSHLLTLLLLLPLGREPGRHLHEDHEPHPPVYRQLLVTFRVLLPTSYLVVMALNPFLPTLLSRVQVSVGWQTPLAATWMVGRLATFLLLERWHGWHGRWYPAVAGIALLLAGFGTTVLSPKAGPGAASLALILIGLLGFGVGMATIYSAALYYAMEVGQAEVEAGGKHEALIGLGYTGGPACGLLAAVAVGGTGTDSFEPTVLMVVGGVAVAAGIAAAVRALRAGSTG